MKALTVLLSIICLVTIVTGQDYNYTHVEPSYEYQPYTRPGQLLPHTDFTVQFLLKVAGHLWQQNSVFDAMTYACEDILPVIGSMIDEVDEASVYWGGFCDRVTRVKNLNEFDGSEWCNDLISMISSLSDSGNEDEERYRRQAPTLPTESPISLESPFGIVKTLINITQDLYDIDIQMIIRNVSTVNTICTDVTENFLRPSPKKVITDFAAELITRLLPEVCQTWESFFEAFGLNSSSPSYRFILDLLDTGIDAVGYDDFDELCNEINRTVQDDDLDRRRMISNQLIRNFIDILEDVDECSAVLRKINNKIWTLLNCGYNNYDIGGYYYFDLEFLLYQYTGFYSIEDVCYAVKEALTTDVDLPRARLANLVPGTNLTLPFFVSASGGAWQQDRLIDVLAYACSDILPAVTTMVPELRLYHFYDAPICREIRKAARNFEAFDSIGYCNELKDMVIYLLPSDPVSNNTMDDSREAQGDDLMEDPLGIIRTLANIISELYNIDIISTLANITSKLYNIDIISTLANVTSELYNIDTISTLANITSELYNIDITNASSTICPNIERVLLKPIPAILLEFGSELMSRFLPLAVLESDGFQPLCRLELFLGQFGLNSSWPFYPIVEKEFRLASRAVGYNNREELCADIGLVVSEGHDERVYFSEYIIKELFRIPTNAETCYNLLNEAIREVVEPLLWNENPNTGRLIRISNYLISRYSGHQNVYDFCQHLETAFTSEVPLPRPPSGEYIPRSQLTISLLINLAGSLWSQERSIDSLVYVCTNVLPVITRTVSDFREARRYWSPFCDLIEESAKNRFDATALCLDLEGMISELLEPPVYTGMTCPAQKNVTYHSVDYSNETDSYQNFTYSYETVEYVDPILAILLNISQIFNIDITNPSTICPLAPRLLGPSLPDVIRDFGSKTLSFLLPLAGPVCQNFYAFLDNTLASFGLNSSSPVYPVIQEAVRIALHLVDYDSIDTLCTDVLDILDSYQDFNDEQGIAFASEIINSLIGLTSDVDKCTQISTDVIDLIIEPLIHLENPGERFNITEDLIHMYTGFKGIRPTCQAMSTAFEGCMPQSQSQFDIDACGECVKRPSVGDITYHFESNSRDCTGRCPREQEDNGPARMNECAQCVGGTTGRPSNAGVNRCGTCGFLQGFDCVGCDGEINSNQEYDGCGICGGDGSSCTAVSSIVPEIIPSGEQYEIAVRGAGLIADPGHKCRFRNRNNNIEHDFILDASRSFEGTCTVDSLPAGTYDFLLIISNSDDPMDTIITLQVYDPITIASVSPEEVTLLRNSEVTLTFTATENSNFEAIQQQGLTPYLRYEHERVVFLPGEIGGDGNQELIFIGRHPHRPVALVNELTFNKIDLLPGGPFTVTFYQPPPIILSLKFYPSENRLYLEFEDGVRIDGDWGCSDIFSIQSGNTLGTDSRCELIRASRIIRITLGCREEGLITTDDTFIVHGDVIFGRSEFSRALPDTIRDISVEAVTLNVELAGKHRISGCGRVKINARRTLKKHLDCRPLTFTWSVQSDGPVSANLSAELIKSAQRTEELDIDGNLLTADQDYEFTLAVGTYLGTFQSEPFTVTRSAEALPDIEILPPDIDLENVPLSKRFVLRTRVTFYDCDGGGRARTEYRWTVNKDNFEGKILGGTDKHRLTIIPYGYTFPDGDYDVIFTVEARFQGVTTTLTSSIAVRFAPAELVAVIKGASLKSVGVDVGDVSLDGTLSYDPDIPRNEDQSAGLTYSWSCVQGSSLCINAQDNTVFPPAADSTSSVLSANANFMTAGETYTITLEVSSGTRRASTSVIIEALAGNPPSVTIYIPLSRLLRLLSTNPIPFIAFIGDQSRPVRDTENVVTEWSLLLKNEEDSTYENTGYEFVTQASHRLPFRILENRGIAKDTLLPGELYTVQVEAQYGGGNEAALARLDLRTASAVSSCIFSVNPYTEFDQVSLRVEFCVTDEGEFPLTYEFYMRRTADGRPRRLGSGGSELTVRGPPPAVPGIGNNKFFAKVCNQADSCYITDVVTVNVQRLQSKNYQDLKEALVEAEIDTGNLLSALRILNDVLSALDSELSRKRRQTVLLDQQTADQFSLFQDAASALDIDENSAASLIDEATFISAAALPPEDLTSFIVLLQDLVSVFPDTFTLLSVNSYEALTGIIEDIRVASEDENILNLARELAVRMTISVIDRSARETGGLETNLIGVTSFTDIIIPEGVYQANSGENASSVDFGTELAERYGLWECGIEECTGIMVQINQYATGVDPYSRNDDDRDDLASSILEITFYDQFSEPLSEVEVDSLSEAISIHMLITSPKQERSYECAFWDTTTLQWSRTGVETVMTSATEVECQTNHLSAFAVFAGEEIVPSSGPPPARGTKIGIIIGCVVGGVVVIIIIIILVIVCASKSKKVGNNDKEMGMQLTHGGPNGGGNENAYDNPQKSGAPL